MRTGLNQQNSEVGKIRFTSEVSHSSQYSRAAELYGLVRWRMAKSMDELTTSASITGDPIPDFENLDLKIASGLGKILTGNFKKQVHHSRRQSSFKEEITHRQTDCLDDLRILNKISGDNEAILDVRDSRKVQLRNDNVQAFDTKWDAVLSAVSGRLFESILDSLYLMQLEKVGRLEILVASLR